MSESARSTNIQNILVYFREYVSRLKSEIGQTLALLRDSPCENEVRYRKKGKHYYRVTYRVRDCREQIDVICSTSTSKGCPA